MSSNLSSAAKSQTTDFDYIIVGSGAGGGPLAARLALAGKRVLLVEAGENHAARPASDGAREVSKVPALHAVSSEHKDLSWEFFVQHYDEKTLPKVGHDPKWHPKPGDSEPDPARRGIFYPRAAALGGCTVHNAMITIAGPDSDWDDLADFLRDDSWRAEVMRPYFQRLERNEYLPKPPPLPSSALGYAVDSVRWLFGFEPDYTEGRHGFNGWLRTSVADVKLGLKDLQLILMLRGAFKASKHAGVVPLFTLLYRVLHGNAKESLDPNHARTQAETPEGLALIPLAVCGQNGPDARDGNPSLSRRGHRSGPREFLLEVQAAHPENLVIATECFVTEVILDDQPELRARGVKYLRGKHLYRAHPEHQKSPPTEHQEFWVKPAGEVILCGGAFNTPQLLMLSGIGDPQHLGDMKIPCRVPSRGVGKNLQDRYEVGVVSEMKDDFALLAGAEFKLPAPSAQADPFLSQWRQQGTGLYASNGSVLGILKRSNPELAQPDLFIFGLPLSFKGYEVGYSKDPKHNFFTWAILKAHTSNRDGTVLLRSKNPLETPEINFNYFPGLPATNLGERDPNTDPDLLAVTEGVKFVRSIAERSSWVVKGENYPGTAVPEDDQSIKDWVRQVAWGHHPCGTCRMGPAGDENAVLDTRFRVLGRAPAAGAPRPVVQGLRVVDASIFPKIPGVFIVTNIYMASEKAADVILNDAAFQAADDRLYPSALRKLEAAAIETRRKQVNADPGMKHKLPANPQAAACQWEDGTTGLALSGGGVRSATLGLGVLQALARGQLLRRIDFLSTVSGGGYIGSFLGRCFDRLRADPFINTKSDTAHPGPDRIEKDLADPHSREINWLRKHGNFIAPSGPGDARLNLAVFLRNLFSVHFVVGIFLFAVFGLANAVRYGLSDKIVAVKWLLLDMADLPIGHLVKQGLGVFWSPWFVLFELILLFLVFPKIIGYWLASQDEHERCHPVTLKLAFLFIAALFYLGLCDGVKWEMIFLGVSFVTAFFAVVRAWGRGRRREEAVGTGGEKTQRMRTRNYLTYDLGLALAVTGAAGVFVLIDTAGHALNEWVVAGSRSYSQAFARLGATVAALVPVTRALAGFLSSPPQNNTPPNTIQRITRHQLTAGLLAAVLFTVPLVFYSFASHAAFGGGLDFKVGLAVTAFACVLSVILASPKALSFVNRSSLAQTYGDRLASAYLGASNPLRHHPQGSDVTEVIPGDDVPAIEDYRPYEAGGPLHLINVVVNQTVDFNSQRGNRDRKGENLAVSCLGMSIGGKCHSLFPIAAREAGLLAAEKLSGSKPSSPQEQRAGRTALIPVGYVRGTEHPLVDETGESAKAAEVLTLRQWIGISGAAVGPSRGQTTELGTALLFGLANLRTGYWWDSGISEAARSGFPKLSFLRRFLYLIPRAFVTQSLLMFEWVARYPGPWERFWQISDGGFFENTAAYELIRRRVPRIIVVDGGADPTYQFDDFANLVRKARIDFNARIEPLDLETFKALPDKVKDTMGRTLDDLKAKIGKDGTIETPSARHAALFQVSYDDEPGRTSNLLYLKATTTGDETADIANYQATHPEFPHEGTEDQCFEEDQWESYRQLGEHIAGDLTWFWDLPVPPPRHRAGAAKPSPSQA